MCRRLRGRAGLIGSTALIAAWLALAASAGATTITVDTVDDDATLSGDCELREAMTASLSNVAVDGCPAGADGPVRDVVRFSIGGAGSIQTIVPTAGLPSIDDPVEIDGRNGAAPGAAFPRIEIDASAGTGAGLLLTQGADASFIHHLAIYDAGDDGIRIQNDANQLSNLVIGLDLSGADHPNGSNGVEVRGANNTITTSVISANSSNGIDIADDSQFSPSTGTTITANRIGTGLNGSGDHGNTIDGVSVFAGAGALVAETTIGGVTGLTPGGACSGDCNVISGNNSDGIDLNLSNATSPLSSPLIRGNFVGTDVAGTAAIGNATGGMRLRGHIDAATVRDNLVSGNVGDGIDLLPGTIGGPSHFTIAANRVGVDTQGDDPLANTGRGINLSATLIANAAPMVDNVIGGTADPTPGGACDGDCNVIGGNGIDGILIFRITTSAPVTGTQVLGNHIGANAAGTGAVANTQWGIVIGGGSGAVIGSPGAPNVISGNTLSGVLIQSNPLGGNVIQSNLIGTTSDGAGALGNQDSGVEVFAGGTGTTVGGTSAGAANTIANNGDAGVSVRGGGTPTASIPVIANSIKSNTGLGIDLMTDAITFGVTPNDGPADPDDGGNGLQNFPVLDTVAVAGPSTYAIGSLDSTASTSFRIDLYANPAPDPSGNGEGAEPLGSFQVSTDGTGHVAFTSAITGTAAAGKSVTATATELDGGGTPTRTSEFAANIAEGCDITGTAAGETLTGTGAAEVICGLGGNDVITGGGGDDVIAGGDGVDTAAYTAAAAGVTVNLPAGTATGGAGSDA